MFAALLTKQASRVNSKRQLLPAAGCIDHCLHKLKSAHLTWSFREGLLQVALLMNFMGQKAFFVMAPILWTTFPLQLQVSTSVQIFWNQQGFSRHFTFSIIEFKLFTDDFVIQMQFLVHFFWTFLPSLKSIWIQVGYKYC